MNLDELERRARAVPEEYRKPWEVDGQITLPSGFMVHVGLSGGALYASELEVARYIAAACPVNTLELVAHLRAVHELIASSAPRSWVAHAATDGDGYHAARAAAEAFERRAAELGIKTADHVEPKRRAG